MHPCKSNCSVVRLTLRRRLSDLGQLSRKWAKSGQNPGHDGGELGFAGGSEACYRYEDSLITEGGEPVHSREVRLPFTKDDIGTLSIFDGRPEGPPIRWEPIEPARAPPSNKTFIGLLFYMNGVANLFDSIKQLTSIHLKLIPTLVMSGSVNV